MKFFTQLTFLLVISYYSIKAQSNTHLVGELLVEDVNKVATIRSNDDNSFIRIESNSNPNDGVSIGHFNDGREAAYFYIDVPSEQFADIRVSQLGVHFPTTKVNKDIFSYFGGRFDVASDLITMRNMPTGDFHTLQYDSNNNGRFYYDTSTRRHKRSITTLKDNWHKILDLRPVTYTRPERPDRWEFGYVAEELDSIGLTNMVGYDNEGIPVDVRYDKMILYLVEVIKLQEQDIENLQSQIRQFDSEVKDLKELIATSIAQPAEVGKRRKRRHKKKLSQDLNFMVEKSQN